MIWNELRNADLPHCLETYSEHLGDEKVGRTQAVTIWKQLFRHPSFAAVTIESSPPIKGQRIVGFGAGVFVQRAFVEAELRNPRLGLNGRVVESVASGHSEVLSRAELEAANTGGGLHSVILCGAWRQDLLSNEEKAEVQMLLAASFAEMHAGYRLNTFIAETAGDHEIDFALSSGVWRMVQRFEKERRALFRLTKEQAFAVGGSIANVLFHYRDPILGLREFDKKLLKAALNGYTDEELALKLGVSLASVKKGWISLFGRITDIGAAVWPDSKNGAAPQVRGKQKRHHVIAYMRTHPEELRPYSIELSESERNDPAKRLTVKAGRA